MKTLIVLGSLSLMSIACSGAGDHGSGGSGTPPEGTGPFAPREIASPAPITPVDALAVPELAAYRLVADTLDERDAQAARLTREACAGDYGRLRTLLGGDTAVEVFHAPGTAVVDVEWIEPGSTPTDIDGPVVERQGAGATLEGGVARDGSPRCTVAPYETFGFADIGGERTPVTAVRIDNDSFACGAASARDDVTVENIVLFAVDGLAPGGGYGSIGTRYRVARGGTAPFVTTSVRRVSRSSDPVSGRPDYVVACSEPERLPDGESVLLAPAASPTPARGPGLYVGRPWQATARAAQDAVNARGVIALRALVEAAADALVLFEAESVERACPGGGSASGTSAIDGRRDARRYAFASCTLAGGRRLDGTYDVERRIADEGDSIKRDVEERYRLVADGSGPALAATGFLTEARSGKRADECGLVRMETVLRLDFPTLRSSAVNIVSLALEDITTARIVPPADDASCGEQLTEHAFSDSGRVVETLADGTEVFFSVNRTGSVLIDGHGEASSSGSDASIRIYDPRADDSLDLVPDYSRPDGARIAIDEHPGRVVLEDTWVFIERP